jgi:hypothetical protein
MIGGMELAKERLERKILGSMGDFFRTTNYVECGAYEIVGRAFTRGNLDGVEGALRRKCLFIYGDFLRQGVVWRDFGQLRENKADAPVCHGVAHSRRSG